MHRKGGDLNRDRQVARPGGWLDWVAKTLTLKSPREGAGGVIRRLSWPAC